MHTEWVRERSPAGVNDGRLSGSQKRSQSFTNDGMRNPAMFDAGQFAGAARQTVLVANDRRNGQSTEAAAAEGSRSDCRLYEKTGDRR